MSKNLLTIEAFAEWCEKQPADKEYDYTDCVGCAFCQYLQSVGFERPNVGPDIWFINGAPRDLPAGVNEAVLADDDETQWTFGALAKRLRSLSA